MHRRNCSFSTHTRNATQRNATQHDATRRDATRRDTTRHDTTRHDTTRHDKNVMSFVTTKPRSEWCVHCGIVVWTYNDSFFPSTAVAIRKATAVRQHHSAKNVCTAKAQSRDLNYCGLKTKCSSLDHEFNQRVRVQEEKCGSCGVGIFTCSTIQKDTWTAWSQCGRRLGHRKPKTRTDKWALGRPLVDHWGLRGGRVWRETVAKIRG